MSVNLPNIHHGTGDDATVATVESSQQSTDATHDLLSNTSLLNQNSGSPFGLQLIGARLGYDSFINS